MLAQTHNYFRPLVIFSAPDCRHWTAMSNAHPDKVALQKHRQAESPMLDWLQRSNRTQASKGHGYINENGLLSQIWTQSPLQKNSEIPGNKSKRCDGCAHGLATKSDDPLQKAYRLDMEINLVQDRQKRPQQEHHQYLQPSS